MAGSSDFGGAGEFSGRYGLPGNAAFELNGVLYDSYGHPISEYRFSPYMPWEPAPGAGWDPSGQPNYAAFSPRAQAVSTRPNDDQTFIGYNPVPQRGPVPQGGGLDKMTLAMIQPQTPRSRKFG